MLCKSYASEFGVDCVIVRPGHIYGPSAKKVDKRISSDFAFRAATGEQLVMKSSGLQKGHIAIRWIVLFKYLQHY